MADISQVKLPNGDTYNLVDETSGYIKSYTDEKVKQTPIEDSNSANYGLIVAYDSGRTETTNFVRSTNRIYINNSTPSIVVGKGTDTQRLSIRPDRISFIYNSGNHQGYLIANSITGNDKTWTLPDKTGTIALTSDIPTVPTKTSDLTNDSGFITSYKDEKVKLTSMASSGSYPLTFGPTSITSGSTYSLNYHSDIIAVPSQGRLDIKRILIHWTEWDTAYVKLDMSGTAGQAPDYYIPTLKFESGAVNTSGGTDKLVEIRGIRTPTNVTGADYVASKGYVDSAIPKVYSSTNTGGYLTMATLPIYDGTVV